METVEIKRRRPGIFWPLLLIVTGVILLLNTIGVIQRSIWDLLLVYWPVLFLVGGLDHIIRGEGWVWGLVSIALGAAFLGANLGYLPWSSLSLLLRLWPLLLIALGLDLIFKGHSPVMSILGGLLAIAMIAVIVWYFFFNGSALHTVTTPVQAESGDISSANIRLSNAVGLIELSSGAPEGLLVDGATTQTYQDEATSRYEVTDSVGNFSLSNTSVTIAPVSGDFTRPEWSLKVSPGIPLLITTSTGAGRQVLDLTGLNLENLDATVALGDLAITLPKEDSFEGELSNPIGSIRILVPQGALVRFNLDTAMTATTIGPEFSVSGDRVYSPGATDDNATMRIKINQPMGRLVIQMKSEE